MKRYLILTALTAVMAFSASAESKYMTVNCIVCGQEGFIDTNNPGEKSWQYVKSGGGTGYACPKASCREQVKKWYIEDEKRARAAASEKLQKFNNAKELEKAVKDICAKETHALMAMKGNPEKQISFMKELVAFCVKNNCNAEDIWSVFAACADIGAVKYFWPDPADEKVYLKAKQQMEKNAPRQKAPDDEKKLNAMMGAAFGAMATFFGDPKTKLKPSAKTGPGALAIGRNKKDNSIRFVESEEFAAKIIAAALANDRKDVVGYLVKQTGGTDADFRKAVADQWMTAAGRDEYARIKICEKLSELDKAKKEANDKFDVGKIDKQIKALKRQLDGINGPAVSADTLAAAFAGITPLEAAEYCYLAANWEIVEDISDLYQVSLEAQTKGGIEGALASQIYDAKNMRRMIDSEHGKNRIALTSISKQLNEFCEKSTGEVGKWYKWRTEFGKNWRAGIVDPWLPVFVSGDKAGEWTWKEGVLVETYPGQVSDKKAFSWDFEPALPSAGHPGYLSEIYESAGRVELKWIWIPGTPDVTRLGYFAGEKEGTFVWKAGIPDPKRIGMITGAKEGEWVLAPGFRKQSDGTVRWEAGLTDPARPGIVSTEKMFCWIPDDKHLWRGSPRDEKNKIGTQDDHVSRAEWKTAMEKLSPEDRKKILGNPKRRYEFGESMKHGEVPFVFFGHSRHRDAVVYFDADDYDALSKELNDSLDVREDYQTLHPAVDKALSGGNRR